MSLNIDQVSLYDRGRIVTGGGSGGGSSAETIDFADWKILPQSQRESGEYYITNTKESAEILALGKIMHVVDGKIITPQYSGVPDLVSWSTGTDSQIAAMIEAFYSDAITLNDIKSVWSVGDSRTITLSAMNATGVGESHRSQTVQMTILDFEHDDLTTAIGNHTKALITVQQKNCLRDASVTDTGGSSNTENGYMNSSNTNVGGWKNCARRSWCNQVYYAALPSAFKNLVKSVSKQSTAGSQSTSLVTTDDLVWLPSEQEIFGAKTYAAAVEGAQYSYYATASNRYKLPYWNSSSVSSHWWERSPYGSDTTIFCSVSTSGAASDSYASYARGIAPACCL